MEAGRLPVKTCARARVRRCCGLRKAARKAVFLSSLLAVCTLPGGMAFEAWGGAVGCGNRPASHQSAPARLLLADLVEGSDRIIYSTDPEMDKASERQEREEARKEEKSWRMLENMNIYKGSRERPFRSQPGGGTKP